MLFGGGKQIYEYTYYREFGPKSINWRFVSGDLLHVSMRLEGNTFLLSKQVGLETHFGVENWHIGIE